MSSTSLYVFSLTQWELWLVELRLWESLLWAFIALIFYSSSSAIFFLLSKFTARSPLFTFLFLQMVLSFSFLFSQIVLKLFGNLLLYIITYFYLTSDLNSLYLWPEPREQIASCSVLIIISRDKSYSPISNYRNSVLQIGLLVGCHFCHGIIL